MFFGSIRPLLVLLFSPSRTSPNFQYPPKPLTHYTLSHKHTLQLTPFPLGPLPFPQICSATIEKALELRRWPLQGYDRRSGARSARFLSNFYSDFMMFYALILSGKGKTDHSKNIPLARNTHSDLLEANGAQSLSLPVFSSPEFRRVSIHTVRTDALDRPFEFVNNCEQKIS